MHKLFDCLLTPLKLFLACLTFHRKEIRLRHLHKRTNPGSSPDKYTVTTHNDVSQNAYKLSAINLICFL